MSRIQLSKIPQLKFYPHIDTNVRRKAKAKHMKCLGSLCDTYKVDRVQCDNVGGTGLDVQWKCNAKLPAYVSLGETKIQCEGWNGPDDQYVVRGSCALEYSLIRAPRPMRKDGSLVMKNEASYFNSVTIFTMIWIAVLIMIVYSFVKSFLRARNAPFSSPTPGQSFQTPSQWNATSPSKSWLSRLWPGRASISPTKRYLDEPDSCASAIPRNGLDGHTVRRRNAAGPGSGYGSPTDTSLPPMGQTFSPMDASFPLTPPPRSARLSPMSATLPSSPSPMTNHFPPSPMNSSFGSHPPTPHSASFLTPDSTPTRKATFVR